MRIKKRCGGETQMRTNYMRKWRGFRVSYFLRNSQEQLFIRTRWLLSFIVEIKSRSSKKIKLTAVQPLTKGFDRKLFSDEFINPWKIVYRSFRYGNSVKEARTVLFYFELAELKQELLQSFIEPVTHNQREYFTDNNSWSDIRFGECFI